MITITLEQLAHLKKQALYLTQQHDVAILLDNNSCANAAGLHQVEFMVGIGVADYVEADENCFEQLQLFSARYTNQFIFTQLAYDVKNELESLSSHHPNYIGFKNMIAFVAQLTLVIDSELRVVYDNGLLKVLLAMHAEIVDDKALNISMRPKVSRAEYLSAVEAIRQHIIEGDVYELNYCMEFFNEKVELNPALVYARLIKRSPVPFATFFKWHSSYLLCASPERFICKKHHRVYSQPIKGTAPRSLEVEQDQQYKSNLLNSEKERAENLMIVDLVRNDLAITAQTGSVHVDELFGIYSFPQVHQLISTVSAQPKDGVTAIDVIKHAFPMGSMTGAPKIMAMELIERYEKTKRGLYSGTVGYFAPNGAFDFNVVIRSLQYNAANNYLSYEVGSAITFDSIAEEEYEECLLKAKAMLAVLC